MPEDHPNLANDKAAFDNALRSATAAMGLEVDDSARDRMLTHYQQMVQTNRYFNLTRITAPADAAVKHYADSLAILAVPWAQPDRSLTVLDVGTGAGFPAIPLAIMCPNWQITAIDGTGKKVRFVADAAAQLGLSNLRACHARAADLKRAAAERFDLILLRAVTKLAAGLAEVSSLVNPAGAVVFYKTPTMQPIEQAQARKTARRLGFRDPTVFDITLLLPQASLNRRLVRYHP